MRRILRRQKKAFTLVELLAVLAMVTLLACLCLPALARVRGQSWQAQCAANLKQLNLALQIYSGENNNKLPAVGGGNWAWDVPVGVTTALGVYGAGRQQMYCPANENQNQDGLWNYGLPSFRVVGYAFVLTGSTTIAQDDQNTVPSAHTILLDGTDLTLGSAGTQYPINPSRRVMVADAILSSVGGFGLATPTRQTITDWNSIAGGYIGPPPGFKHRTSHLNGTLPAGGNVGMLDGHVQWNPYTNIYCHTATPGFWW
jgi:prepilin-type N-terminal cleavage/methylation domain-containing protein/prepilin-type processing-associated H-X9-DG protein